MHLPLSSQDVRWRGALPAPAGRQRQVRVQARLRPRPGQVRRRQRVQRVRQVQPALPQHRRRLPVLLPGGLRPGPGRQQDLQGRRHGPEGPHLCHQVTGQ